MTHRRDYCIPRQLVNVVKLCEMCNIYIPTTPSPLYLLPTPCTLMPSLRSAYLIWKKIGISKTCQAWQIIPSTILQILQVFYFIYLIWKAWQISKCLSGIYLHFKALAKLNNRLTLVKFTHWLIVIIYYHSNLYSNSLPSSITLPIASMP